MRRYKKWAYQNGSWKYQTIWRPVLPLFPWLQMPHSCTPPRIPFRGCFRSTPKTAYDLILVETDGKCQSVVDRAWIWVQSKEKRWHIWGGNQSRSRGHQATNGGEIQGDPEKSIPSRDLCGSGAQSLSVSPISLITGKSLHSVSTTFPEFHWFKTQAVAN